jgi:hypothetical protein
LAAGSCRDAPKAFGFGPQSTLLRLGWPARWEIAETRGFTSIDPILAYLVEHDVSPTLRAFVKELETSKASAKLPDVPLSMDQHLASRPDS